MDEQAIMVIDPSTQAPFTFTAADFDTAAPYDYVLDIDDEFQREVVAKAMARHAKELHVGAGFMKALGARRKSRERQARKDSGHGPNIVSFQGMEFDLYSNPEWITDELGVRKDTGVGFEWACSHPIYPCERLRNIDSGELKVRLRWSRRKGVWDDILTDYTTIANAKDIVKLSSLGVAVTSTRAKNLVDYLADVMDFNYDVIPERKSVSRLGWNSEGFSPYIGDVEFDGNDAFGRTYASIKPNGDFEAWKTEARAVRKFSLLARIILASSFASVLVDPMGCLPFFVHLWGGTGSGKSVAQMVAASVWADPKIGGEYIKTFRSTTVGFEVMAGFFRSLPVIIDELQLARDHRGKVIFNVYELASGTGKMRSNVKLGIAATPHWANCFITSGETPITGEQDGAGALNRVIEVECTGDNAKVIEDGHKTAETVRQHYGHAGKEFIEVLTAPGIMAWAKTRYEALYKIYSEGPSTEKQSHSAALITLADELATKWIFQDGPPLAVDELSVFLKTKSAVSDGERGYEYICDWVSQNINRFNERAENGEIYGRFPKESDYDNTGYVYIIRSAFRDACTKAGINAKALLSHLKANGVIKTRGRNMTMAKKINGIDTECVTLRLPGEAKEEIVTPYGVFEGLDE